MHWLRRNSWWGLVGIAAVLFVFGVVDVASGAAADPAIPLGLSGLTLDELRSESAVGLELCFSGPRPSGQAHEFHLR